LARSRSPIARIRRPLAFGVVWTLRSAAFALLFLPIVLVVALSFGADSYTAIPPSGYSLRWYWNILKHEAFLSGLLTSLTVAAVVTPTSVIIGTLSAYALWKHPSTGARMLESIFMSPIMLPLVVTGLALLVFFNRVQFYGGLWSIIIAHVIITFPYSFRAVLAALSRYDRQLDEAAASLRVGPWATLRYVTLPVIRPGLFAGGLFSFVMSFDDFATTIFLITPGTKTLPISIYQYMEFNLDPTVSAVSTVLIVIAVIGVLLVERFIGMDRFVGLRS
jgi:putative spermidine/putrescine transport system permease protein